MLKDSQKIEQVVLAARRIIHARDNWSCYGYDVPFPATIGTLVEDLRCAVLQYDNDEGKGGDDDGFTER